MKNNSYLLCFLVIAFSVCWANTMVAQEEIDIVDPYEMKVSRSKEADTFYFTQNASAVVKQKMDTLRTYDVFLEERLTPFGKAYMCNGIEVTKQKYLEYKRFWGASAACTPCTLYTYNDKNELKHVAYQYEECLCGSYKEYYADKTLKVEGQFKQNTTGNWENIKSKNICNIRDGVWIYYTETGVEEKRETYVNGKLSSSSVPENLQSAKSKNSKFVSEKENPEYPKKIIKKSKDKSADTAE